MSGYLWLSVLLIEITYSFLTFMSSDKLCPLDYRVLVAEVVVVVLVAVGVVIKNFLGKCVGLPSASVETIVESVDSALGDEDIKEN